MSDLIHSAATAWDSVPVLTAAAMMALKACAVLLVAGVAARALGRISAAKRHLLWMVGIAGAVLLPLASVTLPAWRVPLRYTVADAQPTPLPSTTADDRSLGSSAPVANHASPVLPMQSVGLAAQPLPDRPTRPDISLPAVLLLLWVIGASATLAPWIAGVLHRSRLAAHASDLLPATWERSLRALCSEGLVPARARLLASLDCGTPMTWGIVRPVVLVPTNTLWTENERRNALLHEFAHVRRGDYLAKLLSRLLCTLYWFNPIAWLAARAERLAREQACDDAVLRAGSRASAYAQQLLEVARGGGGATIAAAALTMARRSGLSRRLRAILDAAHDRSPTGRTLFSVTLLLAFALLPPVAAVSPQWVRVNGAAAVSRAGPNAHIVEAPLPIAAPPSRPSASADRYPPVAATAAALQEVRAQQSSNCAPASGKRHSSSISVNDGSSPDRRRWQVKWNDGVCRIELDARGVFRLSPNADDIVSLSARGYVDIEQDDGRSERRVRISRDNGSDLQRSYWVNGDRQEWNAEAAAWFARVLIQLDRRTAFAVDSRLPALLRRGGVDAVMAEVAQMPSSYAARVYYTKLFQRESLTAEQLVRVLETASRTFDSDYDKAELLLAVAKQRTFSEPVYLAYAKMAGGIESDYEKRRALGALLARNDLKPEVVQTMLAATEGMESDYELAELLIGIDRRYAVDETTRPHYVRALSTIGSDYEQRRVLTAIMKAGNLGPAATREIVAIAGRSMKGYELAQFLVEIANTGTLDQATSAAFFGATRNVDSDYERRRVLDALLRKGELSQPVVEGILGTAATIDSDYECAELLVAVSRVFKIDETLRPAYEKAAATIGSDYEYGRAMSAVRRAAQRS